METVKGFLQLVICILLLIAALALKAADGAIARAVSRSISPPTYTPRVSSEPSSSVYIPSTQAPSFDDAARARARLLLALDNPAIRRTPYQNFRRTLYFGAVEAIEKSYNTGTLRDSDIRFLEQATESLLGKNEVDIETEKAAINENGFGSTVSISYFPTTHEKFFEVHGFEVSETELSRIESLATLLDTFFETTSNAKTKADQFSDLVEDDQARTLLIVGHNDEGTVKFPDGSVIEIKEASDRCAANQKLCVFISCRSSEFANAADLNIGIHEDVTYSQAVRLAFRIQNVLARVPSSTTTGNEARDLLILRDLIDQLVSEEIGAKRSFENAVTLSVSVVGSGAVAITVAANISSGSGAHAENKSANKPEE